MYQAIRHLLFKLDPEFVHHLTLNLMRFAGFVRPVNEILHNIFSVPDKGMEAFGLRFKNRLGLAAGYDKDGLGWRGLASLGFGHIEIGTVTLKAQEGNPRPRVFRLAEDEALINRLGFPSRGSEFVLKRLEGSRPKDLVIGVNIGKNKDTPLENAPIEYVYLLRNFSLSADYIVINVSSPNTIGLRRLQARKSLELLLRALESEREKMQKRQPVLVKLAPDLTDGELADALEVLINNKIDGVIATNTTISRNGLKSSNTHEAGGLSGSPLYAKSLNMVKKIYHITGGDLPIIAVGGIANSARAQEMLDAGAVLVQIYTGLVYEGPGIAKSILKGLL
jgi:dihydroorotate dehydrogenase